MEYPVAADAILNRIIYTPDQVSPRSQTGCLKGCFDLINGED